LREATDWYRARSEDVAQRFVREVRQVLQHLEQFPLTDAFVAGVEDPDVRQLPVHNFPYHIVFIRCEHTSLFSRSHTIADVLGTG